MEDKLRGEVRGPSKTSALLDLKIKKTQPKPKKAQKTTSINVADIRETVIWLSVEVR